MRACLVVTVAVLLPLGVALADPPLQKSPFTIEFDQATGVSQADAEGKQGLRFTVRFTIIRHGGAADEPGKDYKVIIEEDGIERARVDVPPPKLSEDLSAVLAIDISGSMAKEIQGNPKKTRIDQARAAGKSFIQRLPKKADCGLILFDHEIQSKVAPTADRNNVLNIVEMMEPRGGTAYLDAAMVGIKMLAAVKGKAREKAVVVMTDGVDLNSTTKLAEVIKYAQKEKIKVYTIGIGEPGTGKPVNSVLVLDHSQSMEMPADDTDKRPKIDALHEAAARFVKIMPETARTTVLPFGSIVDVPENFSNDKARLISQIEALKPQGETAMLDATYDAIATLEAANLPGHKAVVVMTDGIDNISRHRPDDVIKRAQEAGVTLHMLAFGRDKELRQAKDDMERMARETKGTYHHARNEKDLIRIFEDMSIALHDDGIDVKSLTELAHSTGGKYYPAQDINKLKLILEQISDELQRKEYTVTFDSPRGNDGRFHPISVKLVKTAAGGGNVTDVIEEKKAGKAVHGVVVAEMHPLIYLGLLAVLGLMLAVPAAVGYLLRSAF
jgi:VWFA-related protein